MSVSIIFSFRIIMQSTRPQESGMSKPANPRLGRKRKPTLSENQPSPKTHLKHFDGAISTDLAPWHGEGRGRNLNLGG